MGSLVHVCARVGVGWWRARALVVPRCAEQHGARGTVFLGCSHVENQILQTLWWWCCRKKKMWEAKIPNPGKSLLIQSYLGVRGNCTLKGSLFLSLFQDFQ